MSKSQYFGFLALLATISSASASAQETGGPGFDPGPVQIPVALNARTRPVTIKDLLEIRDIHGLSISPDGRYVAFIVGQAVFETNSYRTGLFVIGTEPGSRPVSLGSAGMPQWDQINQWLAEAPKWSPDGKYIFHTLRMSAKDRWQLWRWRASGGPPQQQTHIEGEVRSYELSADGSKVLSTVEKQRDPTQTRSLAEKGIPYDGSFSLYRNRNVVSEALSLKPPPTEVFVTDLKRGTEREATADEIREFGEWESDLEEKVLNRLASPLVLEGHHILDAKISPDRRFVAYKFLPYDPSRSKSIYQLFIKPVRGGTPSEVHLPADAYYIPDYWWSQDSRNLYYINSRADQRPAKLYVVSAAGGPPKEVYEGSAYTWDWSLDRGGQYMACHRQGALLPGEIAVVELSTGKMRPLVDLNPEFRDIELSVPFRIEGVNKYGDAWFAHLVKPLGYEPGKRYPTILTTYRSGDYFLRGASGDENPIQVYAAHGFVVVSFDFGRDPYFRLRPGHFEDFVTTYSSPVASIEMALQKSVDVGIVDPTLVGITGYSRGTEMAAYAVTHTNLFRAASGVAGDAGPYTYYMAQNFLKQRFTTWGLGGWPESDSRQRWQQISPELNANQIHVPILNNDPDSEVLPDLALYTSLTELKKPIELFIYPDELHHINQPAHRYRIYERNLDWFRFWLKGEEDPDLAKAEQYKRWRDLRKLEESNTNTKN